MHAYLREETVEIEMREVEGEGHVDPDAGLTPIAFFANGNQNPSFRAVLPNDTVKVLRDAIRGPVILGLLAEEPEAGEIRAMVGISVAVKGEMMEMEDEEAAAPWKASVDSADAWKDDGFVEEEMGRTALLAFAPLVRLERKHPEDFGEELADLLESALSGATRPSLQARVEQMLEDL